MTASPATAAATRLTLAVLGPRDSAAPDVAGALEASVPAHAGRIRVVVDAGPEDRPDAAVLVVDAVCPLRPDDLEVARGVAARVPLVVALAGGVGERGPDEIAMTLDVTRRRLADAGVPAAVHVLDGRMRSGAAAILAELAPPDGTAATPRERAPAPPPSPARTPADGTVDWLLARRTEAITSRSQSLRQDVQALRIDLLQDLHRALRDLGGRAREEIGAASRDRIETLVRDLGTDADAAVAGAVDRADQRVDALVARHLGPTAPASPRVPAPSGGIVAGPAPRHRAEELLVLVMGAAGGTGLGRMLLSPLAEIPVLSAAVIPLALLTGLVLGRTTVGVRRTQTLRAHMIAVVTDRLGALRAEAEQSLGARVLAAESTITDGFAHDPGPRVADLERRIRHHRLRANAATATTTGSETP